MARKKIPEETDSGAPGWMLTYGDMMTLILTFFILLETFSTVQESKFKSVAGSLRMALGVNAHESAVSLKRDDVYPSNVQVTEELLEQAFRMRMELAGRNLVENVKIYITDRGLHIVIADPLLFDLGSDKLKSRAFPTLDLIAELIRKNEKTKITVEGHTDNLPIHSPRFPSNWELSSARALAVVKYFAFQNNLDPARFSATGYGEYRPIKPNDSDKNRAQNRRVEIYINP
jgi:chemotaxis protein MotB